MARRATPGTPIDGDEQSWAHAFSPWRSSIWKRRPSATSFIVISSRPIFGSIAGEPSRFSISVWRALESGPGAFCSRRPATGANSSSKIPWAASWSSPSRHLPRPSNPAILHASFGRSWCPERHPMSPRIPVPPSSARRPFAVGVWSTVRAFFSGEADPLCTACTAPTKSLERKGSGAELFLERPHALPQFCDLGPQGSNLSV